MGTFGCYRGNYNIEEEKKAIFNEQMAKVLNYGGMMSFEEISMYGYHMGLLKPFAVYPGGSMRFHYNYFEDDSWEIAEYDAETAQLYTNKIGGSEFCDVITAAYFLYEVYDTEVGFTYINGDIVNECDYVGWLNQLLGTDFSMKRRFQIKEGVYRDEQMKNYATEEFSKLRMQKVNESIPKVRTSDFLRSEYWEWDVPDEVKKLKKVFITDDDRLYWWDGTDEVIISDKTKHWLAKLGERHKKLTEELKQKGTYKEYKFLEEFLQVLKEVDEYYRRVFPFQSMFYEFLQNGNKPEYIAAVELLREIANEKENRDAGKLIEYEKSRWDLTDGRITRNKGRMCMKRYLAIMANSKLREEYFEF